MNQVSDHPLKNTPSTKEGNFNVDISTKLKGRHFKQSTLSHRMKFKVPTLRLEDKIFDFGKQKHAAYFVKSYEAISKLITMNYKNGGTEMKITIKNVEKLEKYVAESPEDMASRVEIFIW